MITALFVMVPHLSHYYPTFGLARWLRQRGFGVVYSGTDQFRQVVEQEGFEFRCIRYTDEFVIRSFKIFAGLFLKNQVDGAYRRQRYREFLWSVASVETLIQETAPDVVFLDDTLGHYYPGLAEKTQVVQLSTKLSPRRAKGIPPLNSGRQPASGTVTNWMVAFEWFVHIGERRMKQLVERMMFPGWHDACFQQRYAKNRGLAWNDVIDRQTSFYDGLKNVRSVILAPRELEFSQYRSKADEHYVAFPTVRDENHLLSPAYGQLLDKLRLKKYEQESKIVYISLGTLAQGNGKQAKRFLENAIRALGGMKGVEVVVATGGIGLVFTPSPHIHLLPAVPQLDLLPHCDLMVTHGGMGTLKECLEAGVPMLVYPLNREVDQPSNSARVVARGWGLRGQIGDPPGRIRKQVARLLQTPGYRIRCQQTQCLWQQTDPGQAAEQLFGELGLPTNGSAEHLYIHPLLNN